MMHEQGIGGALKYKGVMKHWEFTMVERTARPLGFYPCAFIFLKTDVQLLTGFR